MGPEERSKLILCYQPLHTPQKFPLVPRSEWVVGSAHKGLKDLRGVMGLAAMQGLRRWVLPEWVGGGMETQCPARGATGGESSWQGPGHPRTPWF